MLPVARTLPLVLVAAALAFSQPAWPPDSGFCTQCRSDLVLNNPAFSANQTVRVTPNGGSGSISFSQFLDQAGATDNRTYVIAASSQPYVVGCRSVNIGSYGLGAKRSCIIIRGETGRRGDVVLVGADPAASPDFWKSSQYGGPSSCGAGQFLQLYNVEHIVVADLTLRNFPGHMLKLDGNTEANQPWYPRDIVFHNLELHDCGDQMIKAAGEPIGCADGVLECSYLHYTDGLNIESNYETQGIDLHESHNWIVRDNVFERMRIQKTAAHAGNGSGVLMWDRTDSILVERNLIVNCDAAIKLGATWYLDTCDYMTAVNNLVIYDDSDSRYDISNVNMFEIGQDVTNGGLDHNTIWNPAQANTGTMFYCPNSVYPLRNNLFYHGTTRRAAGAANNTTVADSSWFVSVGSKDFRLTQNRTQPSVGVTQDIRRLARANPPTVGAYEFAPSAVVTGWITQHVGVVTEASSRRLFDVRGRGLSGSDLSAGLRLVLQQGRAVPLVEMR
jgi:hypothetical protein